MMRSLFQKYSFILVIFALFIASILIRLPNLNRPLSIHNEDATAHVLVTLKSFEEHPISDHRFLPIFTRGGEANYNINNLPSASASDGNGNWYYTSFPPFLFAIPFLILKFFNLPISIISLQCLNIALHFISTILLYKIVLLIYRKDSKSGIFIPALITAVVYLFSAETLWSYSNAYWSASLAQPLWLLVILLVLSIDRDRRVAKKIFLAMTAALFLLCYIDWFGYLVCISIGIYSLIRLLNNLSKKISNQPTRKYFTLFIASITVCISAFLIMVLHFASVIGINEYIKALFYRYQVRDSRSLKLLKCVIENYFLGYGPFIICLLTFLLIFIILILRNVDKIKTNRIPSNSPRQVYLVLWLSIFPITENFLLLQHTCNYTFSTLKFCAFIALAIGFLYRELSCLLRNKQGFLRVLSISIILSVIISILMYYWVNKPPIFRENGELEIYGKSVGKEIARTIGNDEVAFIDKRVRGPLIYYSGRNIVENCFERECVEKFLLNNSKLTKGRIYFTQGSYTSSANSGEFYPWWGVYKKITANLEVEVNKNMTQFSFDLVNHTDKDWKNGIARNQVGFLLPHKRFTAWLKPGMQINFSASGERKITDINNEEVLVNGPPLDPIKDGYPNYVKIILTKNIILVPSFL